MMKDLKKFQMLSFFKFECYVPPDFGLGDFLFAMGVTFWRKKEESSLKRIFLVISTKMAYPTDEALKMIIYLATLDAAKKWTR